MEPQRFGVDSEKDDLATGLGATLYSPAIRPTLNADIVRMSRLGVTSMVLCLEDSIADNDVPEAETNLIDTLHREAKVRADSETELPLLFVRVRTPEQLIDIVQRAGESAKVLSGFVLPKFLGERAAAFMEARSEASRAMDHNFMVMPILESPELAYHESRSAALADIRQVVDVHRDSVLALRIGATDLSGAYGLRRSEEFTVYNIRVVADTIGAVVNEFGRNDNSFVITGPVWEYFGQHRRLFRPQLRNSLFAESDATKLRSQLLAADIDGLLQEVSLDHANGLMGKTVIHPSHVAPIHALSVVTMEQWSDATSTQTSNSGGVHASSYQNKMNESKPHQVWAERIMRSARLFGVARDETTFVDLLSASVPE